MSIHYFLIKRLELFLHEIEKLLKYVESLKDFFHYNINDKKK